MTPMRALRLLAGSTVIGGCLAVTGIVTAPEPVRESRARPASRLVPGPSPLPCPPFELAPGCYLQPEIRLRQLLTK